MGTMECHSLDHQKCFFILINCCKTLSLTLYPPKALEMFIESLLKKSSQITQSRNAKTLTPSHMKQCILSESRFDFLKGNSRTC